MHAHASRPSARPRGPRRRGFVLVLSMLVLMVLSGVGLYALRTSRIDLRSASNLRLGYQAEYVAEAALQQTVLQMVQNPSGVLSVLSGGQSYTIPYSQGMFGELRTDYDTFGIAKSTGSVAMPTAMPQWSVTLSRAMDVSPMAMTGTMIGSVGGTTTRFRMKRMDITSTGMIQPGTGMQDLSRSSTALVRAHVVIGPL